MDPSPSDEKQEDAFPTGMNGNTEPSIRPLSGTNKSKSGRSSSLKHSHSTPSLSQIKKIREVNSILSARSHNVYDYIKVSNVRNFIYADIPLTTNTSSLCPHKHHCAQNAIFKGFFRTFAASYVFKTSIVLATQLFGGKLLKRYKNNKIFKFGLDTKRLEAIYYSVDSIQFAQFVGLMSFTYKTLLCSMRHILKRNPVWLKSLAGFVAALWVMWDNPQRRNTLALYCLVRALGDWVKWLAYRPKKRTSRASRTSRTSSAQKNLKTVASVGKIGAETEEILQKKGVLGVQTSKQPLNTLNPLNKTLKTKKAEKPELEEEQIELDSEENDPTERIINGEVVTFTIAQLLIMFAFTHAPFAIDGAYYKWIKNMGNLHESQIQYVYRSPGDHTRMYRIASEPFVGCHPFFHPYESCLLSNLRDFAECFLFRASRMYFYVHFLPIILFTPKKFFNSPMYYIRLKILNTIRSALFLALYVFNMKHTQCVLRNAFQTDAWWMGVLGGLTSGLSIIVEHKKRRTELCLYVIPRAIEIVLRLLSRKYKSWKLLYTSKSLPVVSFALAISVWMTLMDKKHGCDAANGLNITVLKVIFGTNH